jgi:homoserine kinase
MSRTRDTVTVRVPASTSNCGAGFDSLGLALNLYNRVTISRGAGLGPKPERSADSLAQSMVVDVADAFFSAARIAPVGFTYRIEGDVPPARGLGSSVTVIAGVLAGLNAVHAAGFPPKMLVEIATDLEGHPDNASAGILGGFTVSRCDPATGAYVDTIRIAVSDEIAFVVASPEVETLTKESRGTLPATLPYFDAVRSINSSTYLTAAFLTGDFEKLRSAVSDFMHEPYRLPKIPGGREAISRGVAAGGLTGWLSGSGSSVLCVAWKQDADRVASAMCSAFESLKVGCQARILSADNSGLAVEP